MDHSETYSSPHRGNQDHDERSIWHYDSCQIQWVECDGQDFSVPFHIALPPYLWPLLQRPIEGES
jgi:hypothetical protein